MSHEIANVLFIYILIHQSTSTIKKTFNVHIQWTKWPTQGQATYVYRNQRFRSVLVYGVL